MGGPRPSGDDTDTASHESAGSGAVRDRPVDDPAESYATEWTGLVNVLVGLHTQVMEDVELACGVAASSFLVLNSLLRADQHRLAMNVLTAELGMTSGGFTKLADRLERAGLVQRRSSPTDRRIVFAVLTDEGVAVAAQAYAAYRDGIAVRVRPLVSPDLLRTLGDVLRSPRPD